MSLRLRVLPSTLALVLTVAVLTPSALSQPEHKDERQYIWSAAYFGEMVAHLDFRSGGSDMFIDPGWSPAAYWALTQPMGARFAYAVALKITQSPSPEIPYSYTDPAMQGPETEVAPQTLIACRLTAVLCAALGLTLIAMRFGWAGAIASAAFLSIPHVPSDLARAWAEGPLLLGCGLCILTWGTRWFAPSCGLAAALKLTALPLWILAFHHGAGRFRLAHSAGLVIAMAVWVGLTPPAWYAGGPAFLGLMLRNRVSEYAGQSREFGDVAGLFVATRYLWPLELAAIIATALVLQRFMNQRRRRIGPRPADAGQY